MTIKNANKEWSNDKKLELAQRHYKSFSDYEDDKNSGDNLNLIGSGVAGVGGALLIWAIIRSATSGGSDGASAFYVAPTLSPGQSGWALGGRF